MILPHPLAREISMAPSALRCEVARGIEINDTREDVEREKEKMIKNKINKMA